MRRAFTIVELLVVIGIIAILMGILLPTLSKARQQAATVRCGNNLRQFGTAWQMYAAANRSLSVPGRLPTYLGDSTYDLGEDTQYRPRWYELIAMTTWRASSRLPPVITT